MIKKTREIELPIHVFFSQVVFIEFHDFFGMYNQFNFFFFFSKFR